jgi:hypothetical protein
MYPGEAMRDTIRRLLDRGDPGYAPPRAGATPEEIVHGYVAARHRWEDRASSPLATDESRRAELGAIKAAFCTRRAAARASGMSWGTVSEWQPDWLQVLNVDESRPGRVVVTTRERPFLHEADPPILIDYRYVLQRESGEWRLDSRSTAGLDGKTIGGLL